MDAVVNIALVVTTAGFALFFIWNNHSWSKLNKEWSEANSGFAQYLMNYEKELLAKRDEDWKEIMEARSDLREERDAFFNAQNG